MAGARDLMAPPRHLSPCEQERLIAWALRGYRGATDWEDLQQEARIAIWQAQGRAPVPISASSLIVREARWAAARWRRDVRWGHRRRLRAGEEVPLDWARGMARGDFVPALLARLERREAVRWILAHSTDRERACFLAWAQEGLGAAAIGRREQLTGSYVSKLLKRCIARYRARPQQ